MERTIEMAPTFSRKNKQFQHLSLLCGCYYCLRVFEAIAVTEWTDEGQTALCPNCGIDAILFGASGFPMSLEFLSKAHELWFCLAK